MLLYGIMEIIFLLCRLLARDTTSRLASMRRKIDLIYTDPPFDSKADYRTKIHLPNTDIESRPAVRYVPVGYCGIYQSGRIEIIYRMKNEPRKRISCIPGKENQENMA